MSNYEAAITSLEEISTLLQAIQQVSAQQIQLLTSAQVDDLDLDILEGLIGQRQDIMEAIDLIEEKLREQIGAKGGTQLLAQLDDMGEYADYHKYLGLIKAIILAIKENDLKYQALLENMLDKTRSKLNTVKASSIAQKAYLQEDVYTEGWFIDKKN